MKAGEIIRIIVFSLVGALLMFLGQSWLLRDVIPPTDLTNIQTDNPVATWLNQFYTPGAAIVFGVSVLSTIIWCASTTLSKAHRAEDVEKWRVIWWLIGLLPVLSIGVAIGFFRGDSNQALLPLTAFFVFDVVWLYWFTTATSTPGLFMFIPPFAPQLRGLIGAK